MNQLPLEEIVVEEEVVLEEIVEEAEEYTLNEPTARLELLYNRISGYIEKFAEYGVQARKSEASKYEKARKKIKALNKRLKKAKKESKALRKLYSHTGNTTKYNETSQEINKITREIQIADKETYKVDWKYTARQMRLDTGINVPSTINRYSSLTEVLPLYKQKALEDFKHLPDSEFLAYEKAFDYITDFHIRKGSKIKSQAKIAKEDATLYAGIVGTGVVVWGLAALGTAGVSAGILAGGILPTAIGIAYGTHKIGNYFKKRVKRKNERIFRNEWDIYKKDFANQLEQVK